MKRCWFGGALLLLLLGAGLLASISMGRYCGRLSGELFEAAQITGEHREAAQTKAEEVRSQWERRRFLNAVLSDHAPMEQIEEDFALLNPAAEEEDFRETCLRLSARLKALGEGQLLNWENLF